MFSISNGTISISRGDSQVLELVFTGEVPDGTEALVSMKEEPASTLPLWEKVLSVQNKACRLCLTGDDTEHDAGHYVWDVRLIFKGGDVETVMSPGDFIITEVVGNA